MKILYITYDGINDAIGQSQVVPYINLLSGRGMDFTILSFEKRMDFDLSAGMLDSRVRWEKLRYHKKPQIISSCYDIISGMMRGMFILIREKKSVIHARSYVSAMVGVFLKALFRTKFIFDMRGMLSEERVDAGLWRKGSILYKITKFLENIFLSCADITVVLTGKAKDVIAKNTSANNKRIEVIPTCVDTNSFLPVAKDSLRRQLELSGKFVILYLGSLGTFYALDEMADFFSVILNSNYVHNPYFLIITNNPSEAVYRSMKTRNISKNNYGIRQMARNELKDVLPLADVSLMFYKRILSSAGCCPTKFGESLACGLPVIINSGVGDTEGIVRGEKIGVVVEGFSSDAYKKAINQLMHFLSERDALKRRCRLASLKYFSLDKAVDKYSQIYKSLEKM